MRSTRRFLILALATQAVIAALPLRASAQITTHAPDADTTEVGAAAAPGTSRTTSSSSPTASPMSPALAARVRAALLRYRHEPGVADVVRAARASMPASPTDSMASRAHAAGWVPTLGLSARRGLGVGLAASDASTADQALRLSTDNDLSLTASLTFELDRLLFRNEEIGIVREARAERAGRTDRIREIVRLYFLRRRLQLERDLGAGDPAAQALGIAEAEALLDAFTNGAFGRMLRSAGRRR